MFCLIFAPIRVFFLVFYLFLFSFSLFSALFVLLVVYAAPYGGVCVCVGQRGWVVRHLLCGRGAKHVAIWSTWRRLMRFLFDSSSSPSFYLPPSYLGHTHYMAWLTPIPKRFSLRLSLSLSLLLRVKLCVKIV